MATDATRGPDVNWAVVLEVLKKLGGYPLSVRDILAHRNMTVPNAYGRAQSPSDTDLRAALDYLARDSVRFVVRTQEETAKYHLAREKAVQIRWFIYDLERALYPALTTFETRKRDRFKGDPIDRMRSYLDGFETALGEQGRPDMTGVAGTWGAFAYSPLVAFVRPTETDLQLLAWHFQDAKKRLRRAQREQSNDGDIKMRGSHYRRDNSKSDLEIAMDTIFDISVARESRRIDNHSLENDDRNVDLIRIPLIGVVEKIRKTGRLLPGFVLAKFGPPWTAHVFVGPPTRTRRDGGPDEDQAVSAMLVSGCDPFHDYIVKLLAARGVRSRPPLDEQIIPIDDVETELAKERSERVVAVLEAHQAIPSIGRFGFKNVVTIIDPGALLVRLSAFASKLGEGPAGLSQTLGQPLRDVHEASLVGSGVDRQAQRDASAYHIHVEDVSKRHVPVIAPRRVAPFAPE